MYEITTILYINGKKENLSRICTKMQSKRFYNIQNCVTSCHNKKSFFNTLFLLINDCEIKYICFCLIFE